MYTASHPRARESAQLMLKKLNEHFGESPKIKIAASNGMLFLDGHPSESRSVHVSNLCKALTERMISGFQLEQGLEQDELVGLLEVLLLKPARIHEMGGVEAIITSKKFKHVQLTHTKFLELKPDEEAYAASPGEIPNEDAEKRRLFNLWLACLKECVQQGAKEAEGASWTPPFKGALPSAVLKGTGHLALDLKWDASSPAPIHWEAVQLALENLTAPEQLSVVSGRASLPNAPPSLSKVMASFLPNVLAKAAVQLDSDGTEWNGLKDALYEAIAAKGEVTEHYNAYGALWTKNGKSAQQVNEIKDRLQWDYRPLKDQLAAVEKPGLLWSLADVQRLRLIDQIIEKLPPEPLNDLLEKIIAASAHGDPHYRLSATRAMEHIASSISARPIQKPQESLLLQALIDIFGKEPEPAIASISTKALQKMMLAFARRGDHGLAADALAKLESRVTKGSPLHQNQTKLLAELKSGLCSKDFLEPMMLRYSTFGASYFSGTALPLLKTLGIGAVEALMEMLSSEKDRRRRGQIMDAIRSYGNEILPKLTASLNSDKWYLVRNTLILIAEMADDSCFGGVVNCLGHADKRVQKAAVRTLWRGYGNRAAEPFLKIVKGAGSEIFEEILFGLAQISAPGAIPIALNYASGADNPDRLRALALNVLAANPSPESLPALAEFVKRKGLVISTAEPIAIRVAAAKALIAIGGVGRDKLMEIIAAEPNGAEKDELAKLLDQGDMHARSH